MLTVTTKEEAIVYSAPSVEKPMTPEVKIAKGIELKGELVEDFDPKVKMNWLKLSPLTRYGGQQVVGYIKLDQFEGTPPQDVAADEQHHASISKDGSPMV